MELFESKTDKQGKKFLIIALGSNTTTQNKLCTQILYPKLWVVNWYDNRIAASAVIP